MVSVFHLQSNLIICYLIRTFVYCTSFLSYCAYNVNPVFLYYRFVFTVQVFSLTVPIMLTQYFSIIDLCLLYKFSLLLCL